MAYRWRWEVFLEPAATGGGTYLQWVLQGLGTTVALALSSWVLALAVGSAMGVLRTVPSRLLRAVAAAYVGPGSPA